jgi:hypothetical protein
MMMVASDAANPAARPRAVIEEAVAFFGTRRTSLRQKLRREGVRSGANNKREAFRKVMTAYGCMKTSKKD